MATISYVTLTNDDDFTEFWIPERNRDEVMNFLRSKSISDATDEAGTEEVESSALFLSDDDLSELRQVGEDNYFSSLEKNWP